MPSARTTVLLLVLAAWACAAPPAAPPAPAPSEMSPDDARAVEIATKWFENRHGSGGLETYETRWGSQRHVFSVARRWEGESVAIAIWVQEPRDFEELAFLVERSATGRIDVQYWRSEKLPFYRDRADPLTENIGRLAISQLDTRLPFAPVLPFLIDFVPLPPSEFTWKLLRSDEVDGEEVWWLEATPRAPRGFYDHFEVMVSKRTYVALVTTFIRGGRWVRRVRSRPTDVLAHGDRWLPDWRVIEQPGGTPQEVFLGNLMLEPELPDHLFTARNLRVQRFPSF